MYTPKHFDENEFAKCVPPCKLADIDERLLRKLDEARKFCKFPFIVNSAYRSKAYEISRGRKGTSSHCKGLAMDLRCGSSHVRQEMITALCKVGFRRIGIYPTFIHVDLDDDKVSAFWLDQADICRG